MDSIKYYRDHPEFGSEILVPESITKVQSNNNIETIYFIAERNVWSRYKVYRKKSIPLSISEYASKYCITKEIDGKMVWVYSPKIIKTNDFQNKSTQTD